MPERRFRPALVLAVWTALVWTGRIRNIVADDDLSAGGRMWRLALAVAFTAAAVAVAAVIYRAPRRAPAVVTSVAVFTTVVWTVRGVQILVGDWGVGFKVVHTVLAAVSIGLGWWASRAATTRLLVGATAPR